MGLPATWLHVAETIGVDAFLEMWRILDSDPTFRTEKGDLEPRLRAFRSWLRYQRNRYIETLHSVGKSVAEIQDTIRRELCEEISPRHISRIVNGQ